MENICVAIGCGAIGKSISGYIFSKLDFKVVFADAFMPAVEEMKKGVYSIFVSDKGRVKREDVLGFEAIATNSAEFKEYVLKARVVCTAVGPMGLKAVIPQLAEIFKEKTDDGKVQLFLFENDINAASNAREEIIKVLGEMPKWLDIAGSSIERMTQRYEYSNPAVLTEKFFPVFVNEGDVNLSVEGDGRYFAKVKDFKAYYYRKLHTNNMGHAILGYCGLKKGYKDTVAAANDPEILSYLKDCLREAGDMLIREYGFSEQEMASHLEELIGRYTCMKDDLERLTREPVRKLGNGERIVGTIKKCLKNSVDCKNICQLIKRTVEYVITTEESEISSIYKKDGMSGVLTSVCGLEQADETYKYIISKFE